MPKNPEIAIPIKEVAKQCHATVTVIGVKDWSVRLKIAAALIRFALWIAYMDCEFKFKNV